MLRPFLLAIIVAFGSMVVFCGSQTDSFSPLTTEQADCLHARGIQPEQLDRFLSDDFSPVRLLIDASQCGLEAEDDGELASLLINASCLINEVGEIQAESVWSHAENGDAPTLAQFRTMLFCGLVEFDSPSGEPLVTLSQLDCMLASELREEYEMLMSDESLVPGDAMENEMTRCDLTRITFG